MVQRFQSSSVLWWVILSVFLADSALAHKVEVTEDVAGTWHVEPNHSPKAGESARVWVALTRRGGTILPLDQANCQLDIYAMPRRPGDTPVLQPRLKAIAVETYQGIPGADVVFPQTGLYDLELDCTPKTSDDFQPFQMAYQVTVAEGTAMPASPGFSPSPSLEKRSPDVTALPESSQSQSGWNWGLILLIALAGCVLGAVLRNSAKR